MYIYKVQNEYEGVFWLASSQDAFGKFNFIFCFLSFVANFERC